MSLECELAQVQMKRYLAGEELPSDLQKGLEDHVRACAACRSHLNEQRLKLAGDLAGKKGEKEARRMIGDKPKPGPKGEKVFAPPSPLQGAFNMKTLGLSACLAVVLFAMSAVAKNPTLLFGPKADSKLSKTQEPQKATSLVDHKEPSSAEAKDGKKEESSDFHAEAIASAKKPAAPDGASGGDGVTSGGSSSGQEESSSPVPAAREETAQPEQEPASPEPSSDSAIDPGSELIVAEKGSGLKSKTVPSPQRKAAPEHAAPKKAAPRHKASHEPEPGPRVLPHSSRRHAPKAPRRKPAARQTAKAKVRSSAKKSGGIRVYDSNGRPLR